MARTARSSAKKGDVPKTDEAAEERARIMRLAEELERGLRGPQQAAPERDDPDAEKTGH